MITPMVLTASEAVAWLAAITAAVALISQGYNSLKKRKKERSEIQHALDRAPEVKHQLELGNVGEAVKHLNSIMESQAKYIKSQDVKVAACEGEIEHLKERNDALEAEAQGWETKYREEVRAREQDRFESDRRIAQVEKNAQAEMTRLSEEMDSMKKTFARTLAQLRHQLDQREPGEMT